MRLQGLCFCDRGAPEGPSGHLLVLCDTIALIRHSAESLGMSLKLLTEKKLPSWTALQEPGLCDRKLSDKPGGAYNLSIGLCTPRPPRLRTWV